MHVRMLVGKPWGQESRQCQPCNHESQPHRAHIKEKKWFCCYQLIARLIERAFFPLPHPPLLAVSPTPTNHWTGWGWDFLLVCVIGSSQCVPSPVRAGSRPKAACLDMWVHCRLWASTNLTGRFLLTFPHGYMHTWVEFILPLLFATATFAYNPQPLSCGAPGEADIVPVVAACLLFLTRTQKLGKKKKKMSLMKGKQACLQWYFSGQFRLLWKPEKAVIANVCSPPPDHLYTRRSNTDSGQLWKQLEEENRKRHLRSDKCGPPQLI